MFGLLWGPTVAAVSVVLDHAEDAEVVATALDGLLLCGRIASAHGVDEVGVKCFWMASYGCNFSSKSRSLGSLLHSNHDSCTHIAWSCYALSSATVLSSAWFQHNLSVSTLLGTMQG